MFESPPGASPVPSLTEVDEPRSLPALHNERDVSQLVVHFRAIDSIRKLKDRLGHVAVAAPLWTCGRAPEPAFQRLTVSAMRRAASRASSWTSSV